MLKYGNRSLDHLLALTGDCNVKLLHIWLVDIRGRLKSLVVPVEHLESALRNGVVLNRASVIGPAGTAAPGIIARPDLDTVRTLPWSPGAAVGLFCDLFARGEPFDGDPREVLRKNLKRARRGQNTLEVAVTLDFSLCPGWQGPAPLANGGGPVSANRLRSFREEMSRWLDAVGIDARCVLREGEVWRLEVALRWTDALTMADNLVMLRLATRHLCLKRGFVFSGVNSTGYASKAPWSQAVSLWRHAAEIAAITGEGIVFGAVPASCGGQPGLLPMLRTQSDNEKMDWIRTCGGGAWDNPYIAFSLLVAAALEGIQKGYAPDCGGADTIGGCTVIWPPGREQAIELLEKSELARRALGPTLHEAMMTARRLENEWPLTGEGTSPLRSD